MVQERSIPLRKCHYHYQTQNSSSCNTVQDRYNCAVRSVDAATRLISTVVGVGGTCSFNGDGGTASTATLNYPYHVAVDAQGGLLISDTNNYALRYVNPAGVIATLAGFAGVAANSFFGDGNTGVFARLNNPASVLPDGNGGVLIGAFVVGAIAFARALPHTALLPPYGRGAADFNNWRARFLDNNSIISTLFYPGAPGTIVSDDAGGFLVGDGGSNTVRRVRKSPSGTYMVTTLAGNGTAGFMGDGSFGTTAMLYQPFAVTPDGRGGVLVADYQNCALRRVANGNITTVVGAGPPVPGRATYCGFSGDQGPGTLARVRYPRGILGDGYGGAVFRCVSCGAMPSILAQPDCVTVPFSLQ